MRAPNCPGVVALRALYAKRLAEPEASSVRVHLTWCHPCRKEWANLVALGEEATGSFDPGSRTAMMTTVNMARNPEAEEPAAEERLDLSFLGPGTRPGSLGRIGRYEVLGQLGRGGMGVVFKAWDDQLRRVVAVKVLDPALASRERARQRFVREARAAAAISHPHVVVVHEVGTDGHPPFLVMEYIRGRSLRQRIRQGPTPTVADVVRVAAQVAGGLAAAHEQGIIHRDVNPANIMLEGRVERVKITDFGLARVALGLSELSSCDRVLGTPAYMSPEQVQGEPLDARSDLFSLGCVLYAMLAGRSPFHGGHAIEIVRRVCDHHPPDIDRIAPECPPALAAIIMKLLKKDPAERFACAAELTEALHPLLTSCNQDDSVETPAPPAPRVLAVAAPAPAPEPLPLTEPMAVLDGPQPPPVGWWRVALFTLLVTSLVGLALVMLFWDHPNRSRPRPAPPRIFPEGPHVLTTARDGSVTIQTLAEALKNARPGDRIQLLDSARYRGRVVLDDPERFRDVTIEAAPNAHPILEASGGHEVVVIHGTPGVTLRGLTIEAGRDQFAVRVSGKAEGLTLDGLRTGKKPGAPWAHVYLADGARGTPERPIVIRGGRFEGGRQGLALEGNAARPVEHVRVVGNLFLDLDQHLELLQNLRDVVVADNRFTGGEAALWVNFPRGGAEGLTIENNSMLNVDDWLNPAESVPHQGSITVRRNAVLGRPSASSGTLLTPFAKETWRFEGNLCESGPDGPAAHALPELVVRSREPSDPEFLRPAPGSALLGDGQPEHLVGARPIDAPDPDPDPDTPEPSTETTPP